LQFREKKIDRPDRLRPILLGRGLQGTNPVFDGDHGLSLSLEGLGAGIRELGGACADRRRPRAQPPPQLSPHSSRIARSRLRDAALIGARGGRIVSLSRIPIIFITAFTGPGFASMKLPVRRGSSRSWMLRSRF